MIILMPRCWGFGSQALIYVWQWTGCGREGAGVKAAGMAERQIDSETARQLITVLG
jgi:hypothetical protein